MPKGLACLILSFWILEVS